MGRRHQITPAEAAREILRRDRAQESLVDYSKAITIPGRPVGGDDSDSWVFEPVESEIAAHHLLMMSACQDVFEGRVRNLMLLLPPGSAKSSYASVVFPTWAMGRTPGAQIILASYGSELAAKHSRRARQIASSADYRAIFETQINPTTRAAEYWALQNGSEYMSCGILSGITGNRACLTGKSVIVTDKGPKNIEALYRGRFAGKVLSYDADTRKLVFRQIKAMARRASPDFYRVHSADGNVVEVTGDHRVWTGKGYTEARFLAQGDSLLRLVREDANQGRLPIEEEPKVWVGESLLQPCLPTKAHQQQVGKAGPVLPDMREEGQPRKAVLQQGVCRQGSGTKAGTGIGYTKEILRVLRAGVQAKKQSYAGPFLFKAVQGFRSFARNFRGGESRMEERGEPAAAKTSGASIPAHTDRYTQPGSKAVRGLRQRRQSSGPPHRHGRNEPEMGESCDLVQELSSGPARWRTIKAEKDFVSLVERVRETVTVYDLQVEKTRCFFADGLLVHNCGIVLDDPIKGRAEADSETIRNRTWEAYQSDLLTRLKPGGWQIMILCMAGDTPVLMADGTEKRIDTLAVGDLVATWDGGRYESARVSKHKFNGPDFCWRIKTESGRVVVANERHPFLVYERGEYQWKCLKDLRLTQRIVTVAGSTESGRVRCARLTAVKSLFAVAGYAESIIRGLTGAAETGPPPPGRTRRHESTRSLNTVMASRLKNTTGFLMGRAVRAPSAVKSQKKPITQSIGSALFASITTMTLERFVGFCATIATLLLGKIQPSKRSRLQSFTLERILSIVPVGTEPVYDVQIERTENFIANGVVSHNTRWHEADPAGRILPENYAGESGDIVSRADGQTWRVLCCPAECERAGDPLGRKPGEMLWPEWFKDGHFDKFRHVARTWNALFQQRPAPETGTFFRRDWFRRYEPGRYPPSVSMYGASDYAVTDSGGDFTEHGVFGVDAVGDLWVVDWWYGQTTADAWIEAKLDLVDAHGPFRWFGEAGVIEKAIAPFLTKRMRQRRSNVAMEWLPSIANKPTRARAAQGLAAAGGIHIPHCAWGDRLIEQAASFPAGAYDDAVDVLSLICRAVDSGLSDGLDLS